MTAPRRSHPVPAALLLVLGAVTWVPARYGVMTTWDEPWLGLDYTAWNRGMLIPLLLFAGGAITAARTAAARAAAVAWSAVATGFSLSWVGVAVEFVLGGGLHGGPRDLAVGGWTIYLIGTAVTAVGALALGAALVRRNSSIAVAAVVAGVAILAWPPLLAASLDRLAVVDQLLVGLAWGVVGLHLRPPAGSGSAASRGTGMSGTARDSGSDRRDRSVGPFLDRP
ncbi:hypothetical protein [Blastococcus sp. PRF04-17]|uniref:hypothetical protein n=1 Tax=Blastococcus sp. PRF04-17 TaxID=2933797 RepID=UPI001FF4000F|nr:hypothetical protein [Blastococcus sp. PRF04-17]UOY01381.1 hypothetical protein MVA48_20945 [Blastococcus sp. PRF04-17]